MCVHSSTPHSPSLTEAVVVAAGKIVQKHPFFSITLKGCRIDAEALGDRIGNNGKPLAKLVDKAEDDVAVTHRRTNHK